MYQLDQVTRVSHLPKLTARLTCQYGLLSTGAYLSLVPMDCVFLGMRFVCFGDEVPVAIVKIICSPSFYFPRLYVW